MPPTKAPSPLICSMCGGKFFKASLPHHQKVCSDRMGIPLVDCAYCHARMPRIDLDAHVARACPEAPNRNEDVQPSEEQPETPLNRLPCSHCGRQFIPSRISDHERACAKAASAPRRRAFNSARQRVPVTSSSSTKKIPASAPVSPPPPPPPRKQVRPQPRACMTPGSEGRPKIVHSLHTSPDNPLLLGWPEH